MGRGLLKVVSAPFGTTGEILLREMATSNEEVRREDGSRRWPVVKAQGWVEVKRDDGVVESAEVAVEYRDGMTCFLLLKIGTKEGIVIEEAPGMSAFSLRWKMGGHGRPILLVSPKILKKGRAKIHQYARAAMAIINERDPHFKPPKPPVEVKPSADRANPEEYRPYFVK